MAQSAPAPSRAQTPAPAPSQAPTPSPAPSRAPPLIQSSEKLLECPVCYNVFDSHIFMCKKGHNICPKCKRNVEICPLCRENYEGARNYALEQLASTAMIFACENEQNGCKERLTLAKMKIHQQRCMHRLYKCFVPPSCDWTGRYESLKSHITGLHSNSVSTLNDLLLCDRMFTSNKVGHSDYMFIELDDELFVFFYKREPEESILFNACYIGDAEKASKYRFKLKFENEHKTKQMIIRSKILTDSETEMKEENCLTLDCKTAKQFTRYNGTFQYILSIEKTR